ncbi:hypothetical protein CJJ23_04285 [Mycoplasmopsis agassizii]|uniref:Uncharacterized protein n=1 Tax=Mycoplasmopsis agassizii TaxID=33922 RepID=A0A269THY0_9BACT|nr:hypothetical protein [Mycoplasmopsis agassizii]PAK20997.1 hypothetical protein CJJ23_04285 [Mycoplasmopsis agassizii]
MALLSILVVFEYTSAPFFVSELLLQATSEITTSELSSILVIVNNNHLFLNFWVCERNIWITFQYLFGFEI